MYGVVRCCCCCSCFLMVITDGGTGDYHKHQAPYTIQSVSSLWKHVHLPQRPTRSTHGEVVQSARAALRRFREDRAAGAAPKRSDAEPWRLLLDVPLPVAADIEARGTPLEQVGWGEGMHVEQGSMCATLH
jgi:hypothetical protein